MCLWCYILEEYPNGLDDNDWVIFCLSNVICRDYAETHPQGLNNQPWDIKRLSDNKNLTGDFVERHSDGINGQAWDMYYLSENPNLS